MQYRTRESSACKKETRLDWHKYQKKNATELIHTAEMEHNSHGVCVVKPYCTLKYQMSLKKENAKNIRDVKLMNTEFCKQ